MLDERQVETLLNELNRARGLVGVMINALSGPNDMENDFPYAFEMLLNKLDAVDEIARQWLPDRAERPAVYPGIGKVVSEIRPSEKK